MDVLFTLGLKIATELELSFGMFVNKEVSDKNELKFFGMVFVHVHTFELAGKELTASVEDDPDVRGLRRQERRQSVLLELGEHKEWQKAEKDVQHGLHDDILGIRDRLSVCQYMKTEQKTKNGPQERFLHIY